LNPAAPPAVVALSGDLGTHDPVLIFAHDQYYLFHTGDGVGAKTSTDLRTWRAASRVFPQNPGWIATQVPGATNLWAPDISYFGGSYHLYYSASTFASNRSCIGHATRDALNTGSWTDHGSVMCSNPGGGSSDDFNAIDPNVIIDRQGKPWLAFGSFWGGLKLIELDSKGARANMTLHAIAARPLNDGALEAPFIVWRCGYYYLFVSFDACCKGADSTYKTMVGRSESVTGPYADREGAAMMQGGGTLVLQGGTRWRGPGHNAVIFANGAAYNVYHAYDANDGGNPVLRISELAWDAEGWPVSGGP
jgi:arabinan endo-1,5-alpha-L-arabinosidase